MVMRVGGLASGMDIDSIVENMLKIQRAPLDKLKQKQQILEWQRDDYRSMNTLLLNFKNNELFNMKLTTNYRTKSVSTSDESKVAISATSAANPSSHTISKVDRLAAAEVQKNGGAIVNGTGFSTAKSLYSHQSQFVDGGFGWKDGAILSKSHTVTNASADLDLELENIRNREDWSVKVNRVSYRVVTDSSVNLKENEVYVAADGKLSFGKELATGADVQIRYIGDSTSETVSLGSSRTIQLAQPGLQIPEGTIFTLTAKPKDGEASSKTYSTVMDSDYTNIFDGEVLIGQIHRESGILTLTEDAPVSDNQTTYSMDVHYSHKYSAFSVASSTSKGEQCEQFLIGGGDSLSAVIGQVNNSQAGVSMFFDEHSKQMTLSRKETGSFADSGNEIKFDGDFLTKALRFGSGQVVTQAQNAKFTINGLETERSSNKFTMAGVTFTLKSAFTDGPVQLNVTNDNTKIVENIKSFITKYNELIEKITGKVSETRNKNYQPLSDEERETLSEKQQKKWEEVAKTGLLRRDPLLTGLLTNMRSDFYSTIQNNSVSSVYNQLSKIGIMTTNNYLEGGKLEINDSKLMAAIEADQASVESLFRGEGGIIEKLQKTVNSAMENMKTKAGNASSTNQSFTIGRELNTNLKKQNSLEDRLKMLEARYWKQFSAMETAISKANSQSGYLSQYFA
ncbi:MAG: flagellar filament capping protein FliD [Bacillus sp. (in: firmicutes)]